MKYAVRLDPEAEKTANEQVDWYEYSQERPDLAERWMKDFLLALERLAEHPLQYGFAPENGKWRPRIEIRQMLFRPWKTKSNWRILFTINEDKKTVVVLQVRHSSRPFIHDA